VSSGHLRAEHGGGLARALVDPPDPAVAAAGPPPRPALAPPWSLTAVRPTGSEVELVQRWMSAPHVAEFWRQAWPLADWSTEVARQLGDDHSRPWLVSLDGRPVAYLEVYRVARDVIAAHHEVGPRDLGVHIAIGDPARTGRGLGPRLLAAVADALLAAEPGCRSVLGDPDTAHTVARRAFAAAGFEPVADVDLPHKRATLMARGRPPAVRGTP